MSICSDYNVKHVVHTLHGVEHDMIVKEKPHKPHNTCQSAHFEGGMQTKLPFLKHFLCWDKKSLTMYSFPCF